MIDKKSVSIEGKKMAYVETGDPDGDPIVFLHGNPTSSYLWRNVMPHLTDQGRCLAPDLIGMGDSEKLDDSGPGSYTFVEHAHYLDGWFEAVGATKNVTLVVHDWGSGLGFYRAHRFPGQVVGIAYMEAIVKPIPWSDWPDEARGIFGSMRSEAGDDMILEKNLFVEAILPASVLSGLTEEEMTEYRRPYVDSGESRRPTLTWPRQIPIDGEPADVDEIVRDYAESMATNEMPKLFINADPGAILVGPLRDFVRTWPNQTEVTVAGSHFIQEDSPDEIGTAIATWRSGWR